MTKLDEWKEFSKEVEKHIENYCLPAYGDYPDEMIESMDLRDIQRELERYTKRIGRPVRGIVEAKRDTLKIAHYACFLLTKINQGFDYME